MENAAQRADRDVTLFRDDSRVDSFPRASDELNVTTLLAGLHEPTASSRRLTSRKGCGLSRPNLHLDHSDFGWTCRAGWLEVQF